MTTGFLPRLAEQRTDRAKAVAALALLRANPGVPVIYAELPRQGAITQQTVSAKLRGFTKAHPELEYYTRVGIDGVVRGFLVLPVREAAPEPEVFDLENFVPAARPTSKRARSTKKARSRAALDRIVKAEGKQITVTSSAIGSKGRTRDQLKAEMDARRSTLLMAAKYRGVKIKTKVAVTGSNVRLDARLVTS